MIGPLLQGVMLVGVIYFYSKNILTLINDYYREEFKNQYGKDFKKIEKPKIEVENIENEKVIIINKKNIISSPAIEGLPDIFNSPERASFASGRQSQLNSPTDSTLIEKLTSEEPKQTVETPHKIVIVNSEGYEIAEPSSYPQDSTKCSGSSNHLGHSSSVSGSSETNNQLLDSIESPYKHSEPFDTENDVLKHSNIETISNPLPVNELNYEQIKKQQQQEQVTFNDVKVVISCDKINDGIEKKLSQGMNIQQHQQHHHQNHYLDNNGNHADVIEQRKRVIVVKKDDDKVNEQKNQINHKQQKSHSSSSSSSSSSSLPSESIKFRKLHDDVNGVCISRRKSVNEMIQYWNRQVSLNEENLKVEDKILNSKRRLSSGENVHLNVNGLV